MRQEFGCYPADLFGRLAFSKHHLGKPGAHFPMVIDSREPKVCIRHVGKLCHKGIGAQVTRSVAFQQFPYYGLVDV